MAETGKMKCPDCGAEMNHHADKLVREGADDEGEVMLEAHACPGCGRAATREKHDAAAE
jgi:ribosomal protein S27AE